MNTPESPNVPVPTITPEVGTTTTSTVASISTVSKGTASMETSAKTKGKNPFVLVFLLIVLLIVVAVGIYLFWYNSKTENTPPKDVISMPTIVPSVIPTEEETSLKTYTGSTGFSFVYSDIAWTLTEKPMSVEVPGLDGLQEFTQIKLSHNLDNYTLVINYKPKDSDSDITLYGGAAGEFKEVGSVNFRGEILSRHNLVFEGATVQVHYNRAREFTRGETTYTIAILPNNFEGTLEESNIEQAELVLKTFKIVPSNSNTSLKKYTSPILNDFKFEYPTTWQLSVTEAQEVVPTIKLKANTVFLQKDSHTVTVEIEPLIIFGGEMECYKQGNLNYKIKDSYIEIIDEEVNLIHYHTANSLKDNTNNPQGFQALLDAWTPNEDDDQSFVACGTIGTTMIVYTTNNYPAMVNIKYFYPSEEDALEVEKDIEIMVTSILENRID